jgi:hypothetical protein
MLKTYIGFDCATKTFAFSIVQIDIESFLEKKDSIRKKINAMLKLTNFYKNKPIISPDDLNKIDELIKSVNALNDELQTFLIIVDGETVDLVPDRSDDNISTVDRVRALSNYIDNRIMPSLNKVSNGDFIAIIEYQMSQNLRTRAIENALVAFFIKNEVIIVGPALKNKVAVCEEGKYCYFTEKYSTSYCANKAHTKFNFDYLEKIFGTNIRKVSPALHGHIADSFMQIIGYLQFGQSNALF